MRVVHLCSGKKSAQVVCKDAEINSGFGAFYLPFHFLPLCRRIARTHTACERLSRIHFGRRLNVFVYEIIFLDVQCTAVQRASRNHFILRFIQTDFVYRMHTLTHTGRWSLVTGYCQSERIQTNNNRRRKNGKYIFGDRLKFTITITTCHITGKSTHSFNHIWHILIFTVFSFSWPLDQRRSQRWQSVLTFEI